MSPERRPHKKEEKADQIEFDLNQIKEKKKKPTKKELKNEKKHFRQLWNYEEKNGVHDSMQKRPSNNPLTPHPMEKYVIQEKKDRDKINHKKKKAGFRLNTNPNIVLSAEQFAAYTKWVIELSDEEKINLALTNAEIYDRKRLAGLIEAKCKE